MIRKVTGERSRGYTQIGNEVFHDKGLSLKAVGLLCLLWSLKDEWNVSASGLASVSGESAKSIRALLRELENAEYLKKRVKRSNNKFAGYDIVISDFPACPFWEDVKTKGGNREGENGRSIKYKKYIPKKDNTKKEAPLAGIFDDVKI